MTYALARPLGDIPTTNTAAVRDYTVGKTLTDPYLDAVLTVHGISSDAAPRVPSVVKSVLESTGATVQKAKWGTTAEGTSGKVYVEWKPDKTYNAVDYANIAQRLFKAAAEQFTAGSQISMGRYRIYRVWPLATLYAYPTGESVPASAPELAKATLPGDIIPGTPGDVALNIEQQVGGLNTWQLAAVAGGGVVALGVGYWLWRKRMKPNRKRRRSVRRNRTAGGISWARSHQNGAVHGRDTHGHEYVIDTSDCYTLWVDGHRVTRFESVQAAVQAAERGTALTRNATLADVDRRLWESLGTVSHNRSFTRSEFRQYAVAKGVRADVAGQFVDRLARTRMIERVSVAPVRYHPTALGWERLEAELGVRRNTSAKRFEPGDIVRLTGAFLRSTGQYTGAPINGLVKKPPRSGDMGDPFVYVLWNDQSKPAWVNSHNLELDPTVPESMRQMYKRRPKRNPSKPGKHGTLHKHTVRWRDAQDTEGPTETSFVWAYNQDHAIEKTMESAYEQGWPEIDILKVTRTP